MNLDEAKKYLAIDRNRLLQECEKHPSLFYLICEEYLHAVDRRDFLKEKRDTIFATLFVELKKSQDKVSDTLAKAMVESHEDYIRASEEYLEAKKEADLWGAMKEAFVQRGMALKMLVDITVNQLYSNYCSFPSTEETKKGGSR